MAKSTVKGSKLRRMPAPKRSDVVPEAPEPAPPVVEATPETPFDESPPQIAVPLRKPPKSLTFFERIAEVNAKDWGTRATIKVYRLAPIINRLVSTENKYITQYFEPVTEEKLKVDHGSGKYRLYFTLKTAGIKGEKELDSTEIDILDQNFPPKIPAGEWMEDPRNKQWAWARPANLPVNGAAPAANVATDTVLDAMRLGVEITKQASQDAKANMPAPAAPIAAPVAPDPFDTVQKILNMRSVDPMMTLMMTRMEAQDKAAEAARNREAELQKELRELTIRMLTPAQNGNGSKSLIEQIKELAGAKTEIMNLLGIGGTDGAAAPRSRMSGTMEFWKDLVTEFVNAPAITNISQVLLQRFMQGTPGVAMSGANPAQNGVAQSPAVNLIQWVQGTLMEPIVRFLNGNSDGGDFADYVFEGWPDRLVPLQRMTHPQMPGQTGAPVIIELFRHSDIWQTQLAYRETQFRQFVQEFCAWRPEGEPDPAPQTAANPHVPQDRSAATPIDLDSEEAGKGEEIRP